MKINIKKNITGFFSKCKNLIKGTLNKIRNSFHRFIERRKQAMIDWKDLILGIVGHGLLLSMMVWGFNHSNFLTLVLSLGILFYYITEELPLFWLHMRIRPR